MNRSHTITKLCPLSVSPRLALAPVARLLIAATLTAGVGLATPLGQIRSPSAPAPRRATWIVVPAFRHRPPRDRDRRRLHPDRHDEHRSSDHHGLIPSGTPLADISNVEVEIYHVFPKDSADPPFR
jgi:hypothetical protein